FESIWGTSMGFCRARVSFLLLIWASVSSGAFEDRIVKIHSGRCGDSNEFRGSGLLFREGGRAYVLTSGHVVLHSNQGYCHKVVHSTLGEIEAEYATSEWGNGLALMVLPKAKPESDWMSLSDLVGTSVQKGEGVVVTGFPFASAKPIEDARGKVLE